MIQKIVVFILVILTVSCSNRLAKPPVAQSVPVIDEYHGQKIEDPYRNLENLKDSFLQKLKFVNLTQKV